MESKDRLFVPLKSEFFDSFERGEKKWELRGINSRFNTDRVEPGREVELRKGYNGKSLWGVIEEVKTFGSIEKVAEDIDYNQINPESEDREEFNASVEELLSNYDEFIAFRVKPD